MRCQLLRLVHLLVAAPLSASFSPPFNLNQVSRAITLTDQQRTHNHHQHEVHAMHRTEPLGEPDVPTPTAHQQHRFETIGRRGMLFGTAASLAAVASSTIIPTVAFAADEASAPNNVIMALVTLNLSIARGPPRPLRIELFQDAQTAASADFFLSLANGTMKAPCALGDNTNIEICEDYASINVGYKGSQLWRLVPGKRLDFGRVDSMFASRVPPIIEAEQSTNIISNSATATATAIQPSTRGAVSIKRGGGAFEFTVTPSYNPELDSDREDLVVVGRVAEEDLPFIDEINAIPVRRDIVKVGDVPPLGAKFARACDFTAPDSTCAQFKPLKKIIVTEATVVTTPQQSQ